MLQGFFGTFSPVVVALVLLGLLVAAYLALGLRNAWERRVRRQRCRTAVRGERRAARLLERSGFNILAHQAVRRWTVEFDDEPRHVELRVDYLVTRSNKLYVADAKTGTLATSWSSAATRRQLLEYLLAYRADGALLLDMDQGRIIELRFPELL